MALILLSVSANKVYVSQAYRKIDITNDRIKKKSEQGKTEDGKTWNISNLTFKFEAPASAKFGH